MTNRNRRALPTPARPTKKIASMHRLTPRRPRQLETTASTNNDMSSSSSSRQQEEHTDTLPDTLSNRGLLATLAANCDSTTNTDTAVTGVAMEAPYSPPRSKLDRVAAASTKDLSVLSPREATTAFAATTAAATSTSFSAPSSPVTSYRVPDSLQVQRGKSNDSSSSSSSVMIHHGQKRRRSLTITTDKENQVENRVAVSQLFPGGVSTTACTAASSHTSRRSSEDNLRSVLPHVWDVDVQQLSPAKKQQHYWNFCYGATASKLKAQPSWSASRVLPPKGCISAGPKKQTLAGKDRSVATAVEHPLSPVMTQSQSVADEFSTPKTSPLNGGVPRVTTVQFGLPHVAEFEADHPAASLTPMPDKLAAERFPIEDSREQSSTMIQETKNNSAVLAEWEDSFELFVDDENDEDGDTTFSLPAPPSRKRERRDSSFFSPSEGSISLLDCSSEDDLMGTDGNVDDSMLDLPSLEALSVYSPRVSASLPDAGPSFEVTLAEQDTKDCSPDNVRQVNQASGASPIQQKSNVLNVWDAFKTAIGSEDFKPEEWNNGAIFGSFACCQPSLLLLSAPDDREEKAKDQDADLFAVIESIQPVKQAVMECLGRLENYTLTLNVEVPEEHALKAASELPQGILLRGRVQDMVAHEFETKIKANLSRIAKRQMVRTAGQLQAEEKRLYAASDSVRATKRVELRVMNRLVERLEHEVKELEDLLRAAKFSQACDLNVKLRLELLQIPAAALMHQALNVISPIGLELITCENEATLGLIFRHSVEGIETHISCDLSGTRFSSQVIFDAVDCSNCEPEISKNLAFIADFYSHVLEPFVAHQCNICMTTDQDLPDTLWYLGTMLGRLDQVAKDLTNIAMFEPSVTVENDQGVVVVVSIPFPLKAITNVYYDISGPRFLNQCLPRDLFLHPNGQLLEEGISAHVGDAVKRAE